MRSEHFIGRNKKRDERYGAKERERERSLTYARSERKRRLDNRRMPMRRAKAGRWQAQVCVTIYGKYCDNGINVLPYQYRYNMQMLAHIRGGDLRVMCCSGSWKRSERKSSWSIVVLKTCRTISFSTPRGEHKFNLLRHLSNFSQVQTYNLNC